MAKKKQVVDPHPVRYRAAMLRLQLEDLEKRKGDFPKERQEEVSQKIKALKYKIANCENLMKKYPI